MGRSVAAGALLAGWHRRPRQLAIAVSPWIAVALLACDRPPPPPPTTPAVPSAPSPADQPGPWTRPCPDLEPTRPPGFVLRYELHDYEAPEKLLRFDIVERGVECPPDEMPGHLLVTYQGRSCVEVAPETLDQLYELLRRHQVDKAQTRALPEGPHHGGTAIGLSFQGQRCTVANISNNTEVAPDDLEGYRAAAGAIHDAIYEAQQRARRDASP